MILEPPTMTDSAERVSGSLVRDGLVAELARVLDALSGTWPDPELLDEGREALAKIAGRLETLPMRPEAIDLPAHSRENPRLQPTERGLIPTTRIRKESEHELSGTVCFSPRFGGTVTVHGGAIGLFFDDFLGRLANSSPTRPLARTAYLHIDFRSPTPLSTELTCHAWMDRVDGRKRILRGSIRQGQTVVAEAEGLWVEARRPQKEHA